MIQRDHGVPKKKLGLAQQNSSFNETSGLSVSHKNIKIAIPFRRSIVDLVNKTAIDHLR